MTANYYCADIDGVNGLGGDGDDGDGDDLGGSGSGKAVML